MDIRAIFMGLAFALMWSSAFTSARIIVAYAPPMASLSLRFLISGLIGVGLAYALGQTARLDRNQWIAVIVFGVCQNALYLGLNFVAMQTVEASLASIIASSLPLLVGLIGWLVFGDRLRPLGIVGLIVGFAGVGLIMGARFQGGGQILPGGPKYDTQGGAGSTIGRGAKFCFGACFPNPKREKTGAGGTKPGGHRRRKTKQGR